MHALEITIVAVVGAVVVTFKLSSVAGAVVVAGVSFCVLSVSGGGTLGLWCN